MDKLLTMTGYYDGSRSGLCTYLGETYFYESTWEDIANQSDESYAETHDRFMLVRADATSVELALESWAIWKRWEAEFKAGRVAPNTHPGLPGQNARMSEIEALLKAKRKNLTWSIYAQIVESKYPGQQGAVATVRWEKLEMPTPERLDQIRSIVARYKCWSEGQ